MNNLLKICAAGLLACAFTLTSPVARAAVFAKDDPLWVDADDLGIPKPTPRPASKLFDFLEKQFLLATDGDLEALNTNTLGEVPDSTWYENRMSRRVMTVDELVRGPDRGPGPDMSRPWTIIGAKTEGDTPGLTIRDGHGEKYLIKFDPYYWPQMATSTEVIGTKFFHAFGYHVPENYLVHWKPEYTLDPKAKVVWSTGYEEKLSKAFVKEVLEYVPVRSDGTIQVMASKYLDGKPLGPFDFHGTREDDPNDLFAHEDRRELRGYRVFCAWLNHNDSDSVNTLDMYVSEHGRSFVRHYLLDFGTILGSGGWQPHSHRVGFEYYFEPKNDLKAALSLGIWQRPWTKVKYKEYRAVGRVESAHFDPATWKPDYPNPAFEKMQPADAFWAARTVARFTDDMIRAIVRTGEIEDRNAEAHLVGTIIERRDKVLGRFFTVMNPLDEFNAAPLSAGGGYGLSFRNLGLDVGLASRCRYSYDWYSIHNETGAPAPLGVTGEVSKTAVPIPDAGAAYIMVRIRSEAAGKPAWRRPVDVFLRMDPRPAVVGIDRTGRLDRLLPVVRRN